MKTKTEFEQNKYERLTPVRFDRIENNHAYWIFQCDCGSSKSIKAVNVRYGKTRSCGCLALEARQENMRYAQKLKPAPKVQDIPMNKWMSGYKSGAKKRNLEFSLTKEQFVTICESNCHYCGLEPKNKNGIDRVDNTKGYTLENSVPCCYQCNQAKSDRSVDEFLNWAKKVYNNLLLQGA